MKRPIDLKRESAFQLTIAIPPGAELLRSFSVEKKLYAISSKSIHTIRLADSIDPGRENEKIPHVQQFLLNYGADDEFVGKILLTCLELMHGSIVDEKAKSEETLKIILDITIILAECNDFYQNYVEVLKKSEENIDRTSKGGALELPHYERLSERVKTFASKIADAAQRLFDLYTYFYGRPEGMWSGVKEEVEARYGKDDPFSGYISDAERFLRFIRNMRNCIQHEKNNQRLIITDFEMRPDGNIYRPTIEIVHPDTPEPQNDLEVFVEQVLQSLVLVCEHMIVFLAEKHAMPFGALEFHVVARPEDMVRHHVRYSFQPFNRDGSPFLPPK